MLNKMTIEDIDVKGKRVLVRVDFNVPQNKDGSISDYRRIDESLKTIQYLVDHGAKVVLMSHWGRPKGVDESLRLAPIADYLSRHGFSIRMASDCVGPEVEKLVANMKEGSIVLLENLRFHAEEEKNDQTFVEQLARLGDLYVNDAFGTAHRAHASTEGVAHVLPGVAGFLMQKEITHIGNVLENAARPLVAISAGKKVSDKVPMLRRFNERVDKILVGGASAFTFLAAQRKEVGSSLVEQDCIPVAGELIELMRDRLVLPTDFLVGDKVEGATDIKVRRIDDGIPAGYYGLDIGPQTVRTFGEAILDAGTVIWNGPMGRVEEVREEDGKVTRPFAEGTRKLAQLLAGNQAIVSVIGGGDTALAMELLGFGDSMTHISTGGGAAMEMLEGKELPGIAALKDKAQL